MPRGDLALFIGAVALAIALAEMQVQREATTRYVCLALVWIVLVGMLIWTVYGA
jgi:uncharacterized protein with PQ loop repeat